MLGNILRYVVKPIETEDKVALRIIRLIIEHMQTQGIRIALKGGTSTQFGYYPINPDTGENIKLPVATNLSGIMLNNVIIENTIIHNSTIDIVALWAKQENIGVVIDQEIRTIYVDWR